MTARSPKPILHIPIRQDVHRGQNSLVTCLGFRTDYFETSLVITAGVAQIPPPEIKRMFARRLFPLEPHTFLEAQRFGAGTN